MPGFARQGPHKVIFASDLATAGAIDMQTPDGKRLRSHIIGLSYFDKASGQSVLIAEVTNSIGALISSNQVLYQNAFTDFKGSVRYTYTRAGLEQDVIMEEAPPAPEAYGLNSATTVLQILTEFLSPPQPSVKSMSFQTRTGEIIADEDLDFGVMKLRRGKAFMIGADSPGIPVKKQWLNLDRRWFLVEEVPIGRMQSGLETLPKAQGASLDVVPDSVRHVVSRERLLPPPPRLAKAAGRPAFLAKAQLPGKGLVLDYTFIYGSLTNYSFACGSTYAISGPVFIAGTTTIEGGTTLKYYRNAKITVDEVKCLTGPYRPATFTASDDTYVGESVGGNGSPTGWYAKPALEVDHEGDTTLEYLRFAFANTALSYPSEPVDARANVRHVQFFKCYKPFYVDSEEGDRSLSLHNALITQAGVGFNGRGLAGEVEHLTVDNCTNLLSDDISGGYTLYFTNSILSNVGSTSGGGTMVSDGSCNLFYNASTFGSSYWQAGSSPFQAVRDGRYYLAADSPYRNVGTTNIEPGLAADLRQMTTYPPIVLLNTNITSDRTFIPQAQRDTDEFDLGYHYYPIDYLVNYCTISGATLTVTEGAALGCFSNGIGLSISGSSVVSVGSPLRPNWFVQHCLVQEGYCNSPFYTIYGGTGSGPLPLNGEFRFSHFVSPWNPNHYFLYLFTKIDLRDCQFWGGQTRLGDYNSVRNSLFARTQFFDSQSHLSLSNNLFFRTTVEMSPYSGNQCQVYDNSFDNCVVRYNSQAVTNANNAYINCQAGIYGGSYRFLPTDEDDVVLSSFAYTDGPLGYFYHDSTDLVDAGSVTADLNGLYHFTTQADETKEADSPVDIGFHYVALDANGKPVDTDSDGLADYFEDSNGNGAYGTGDLSDLSSSDTDGDGMPDGWEWKNFGNFDQTAEGDYDNDGISNQDEYWRHTDPNTITFTMMVTNRWVRTSLQTVQLGVTNGVPFSMAMLVDSTNLTAANWIRYNSTLTVNLGSTQGWHEVWVGLRGRMESSEQTWHMRRLKLDFTPPLLAVTNPASGTVSQPMIQLQGYSPEALSSLHYDLTNAAGVFTNQQVLVFHQEYDTNTWEYTTNYFQGFDINLTNGINTITLHATDLAGNVTATNFSFTLVSDTNAPVLDLRWPQDGTKVCGDAFTVNGLLDDFTATITASIVDTNGVTNVLNGLVERNGKFWVENLPLEGGTNLLTLTAADAWGNTTTTNIAIVKSELGLTIDVGSIDPNNLFEPTTPNVSGSINDSSYTVWVNGVQGSVNGSYWLAQNVPINEGGTAIFNVKAYPPGHNPSPDPNHPDVNPPDPDAPELDGPVDKGYRVYEDWDRQSITNEILTDAKNDIDGAFTIRESYPYYHYATDASSGWGWWTNEKTITYSAYPERNEYHLADAFMNWPDGPSGENGPDSPWHDYPMVLLIQYEYCEVTDAHYYQYPPDGEESNAKEQKFDVYQRSAQTAMKLYTGGKAIPGRKRLWRIQSSMAEIIDIRAQPRVDFPLGPRISIPNDMVEISELGDLGSDGSLYVGLWDDFPYDITPRVKDEYISVTGQDFYVFSRPGVEKFVPYITANGHNLEDEVPEFCVGQKVVLYLDWYPEAPPSENTEYEWVVEPDVVNYVRSPVTPDGSSDPGIDFDLFTENPTDVWFYSGGLHSVWCSVTNTFPNGQVVPLLVGGSGRGGEVSVYRPSCTFTDLPPSIITNDYVDGEYSIVLGYGSGASNMSYVVRVTSKYEGQADFTQLIDRNADNGYNRPDVTGGFWLDNYRFYKAMTSDPNHPSIAFVPAGSTISLMFFDGPSYPLAVLGLTTTISDSFKDYIVFRPFAGNKDDNLYVSLGRIESTGNNEISWAWSALTTWYGSWSAPTGTITRPSSLNTNDEFPKWEYKYVNP
jgi:hypothetical protein